MKEIVEDKRMDGCGECVYRDNPVECRKCTLPVGYHWEEVEDKCDDNV